MQVGNKLRGFGATLFSGTATLFEQVQEAIAQEIEGIDVHVTRGSRTGQRPVSRCDKLPARSGHAWVGLSREFSSEEQHLHVLHVSGHAIVTVM